MKKPGKIYAAVFLPRDNVLSKENRGDKIPMQTCFFRAPLVTAVHLNVYFVCSLLVAKNDFSMGF